LNEESPRCPVCQARFRGAITCSRCGADLRPLMFLAARASRLREDARQAILAGDFYEAGELARQADSLCRTSAGRNLLLLCRWLLSP